MSALVIGLVGIAPAQATTIANLFELDGNPTASSPPGDDWSSLIATGGAAPGFVAKCRLPA